MLRRFIHRSLIFEKRCWERNGFFDIFINGMASWEADKAKGSSEED